MAISSLLSDIVQKQVKNYKNVILTFIGHVLCLACDPTAFVWEHVTTIKGPQSSFQLVFPWYRYLKPLFSYDKG
jgi:hypothetical protein